jgi:hypothetical protein
MRSSNKPAIFPGAAHKNTPFQQIDVHAGFGLSAATVDRYIGIGYSFRFQPLRR